MKTIEIDEELYQYIASKTEHIGESASNILRRLLNIDNTENVKKESSSKNVHSSELIDLVNSNDFLAEQKNINRFISILSTLYCSQHSLFSIASTSLHGRKRRYLAKDKETLQRFGNNTKPRHITNTPYFVITNTNTARKVSIIEQIMKNMNFDDETIYIVKTQFLTK